MYIFGNYNKNELNCEFTSENHLYDFSNLSPKKFKIINRKNIYKYIIILLSFITMDISLHHKNKDIKEPIIIKSFEEECKNIKKFMFLTANNILIDKDINLTNYISEKPKLSVIIPIYNGELYIKSALTSIQNQDMKDIEIILVDDCSNDTSVKIINELMKNDPRIKLIENKKNKGILYTKWKGIHFSKGKYVIILDEDDIFAQREAFSTLYDLAIKDDLDILGFSSMFTEAQGKIGYYFHHYYETPIIYQPNIIKLSHNYTQQGKVERSGDNIWCYLFKTKTLNYALSQIDNRTMETKMICHEDYLILFLITRNAIKSRQIKRIFHVKITFGRPKLYKTKSGDKNKMNLFCTSYLNYIEFILIKTNNTIHDKKIPSFELEKYFLNRTQCRNNLYVRKRAVKVCKLFLQNEYIEKYIKNRIIYFFHEKKIVYK